MLIDTHAHLTWASFKIDFDDVIKRTIDADVGILINAGADLQSSMDAANLDCSPLINYSSIGLHPEEAIHINTTNFINENVEKLKQIYLKHPKKVIAVGECGLDYFKRDGQITEEEKRIQYNLFQAQIALAKKLKLPLIIHSRDSWPDIFVPELKDTTGVFHSFTGNMTQAKKILDLGYLLGFNCIVTYSKNEELRDVIKVISLEKILIETDCPFLPPQNLRGQRNEPANVVEVVKTIAEIKDLSFKEVAQATLNNAKLLFRI